MQLQPFTWKYQDNLKNKLEKSQSLSDWKFETVRETEELKNGKEYLLGGLVKDHFFLNCPVPLVQC